MPTIVDYQVIGAVDLTLRDLLWSEMQSDTMITSILANELQITMEPPFKLVKDTELENNALSLYLYRVDSGGSWKDVPPQRADVPQPLALNLFYLMTPLTNSADNDHTLLGKALQIFHQHPILSGSSLKGVLMGTDLHLKVTPVIVPQEELQNLWSAFKRPYRLSISYQVTGAFID